MPNRRLDSWKEISLHLRLGVRTVHRWHTAHGLPVRHVGGKKGVVYAYSGELDHWLKLRSAEGTTAPYDAEPGELPAIEAVPGTDNESPML